MNQQLLTYLPFTPKWIYAEQKKAEYPNQFYTKAWETIHQIVPKNVAITAREVCEHIGLKPDAQQHLVLEMDKRPVQGTNEWSVGKIIRWEEGYKSINYNTEKKVYEYTF